MKKELMEKRNETYLLEKLIYYIIFDIDNSKYDSYSDLLKEKTFLISLKNIIGYHTENGDFSHRVKENIYNFLNYIRFDCGSLTEDLNLVVNDIIGLLNCQKEDNSNAFYAIEMYRRTNEKKYVFKPNKYKASKEDVNGLICNDFLVVSSHDKDYTSDDSFDDDYLPLLVDDLCYYYSLNVILEENPLIFLDKTFYNRMMKVLEINSKYVTDFNANKTNKTFIKAINSEIKKYK